MQKKIQLCILKNETSDDHSKWIRACESSKNILDYDIIDLTTHDWFQQITSKTYDYFLARPPGLTAKYKQLYDERIYIIDNVLKLPIYPTPLEIYIYENKRFLAAWLKANRLPHPETWCFYYKNEAMKFLKNSIFPLVGKVNIGASGSGVRILHTQDEAEQYVNRSFSSSGAPRRWGPNLAKGNIIKRGMHYVNHPGDISKRLEKYKTVRSDIQSGFILLQEYIPHEFEWRVVAIGDSYFAHKKLKIGEKASGSTLKKYDNPPLKLFDFARNIMMKYNFTSQAIDIFETIEGKLLINEIQCVFGQSDSYQMLIDDKPGRYIYINNDWIFEEGDFNQNESYNLRVENILQLLNFK